MTHHLIVGLALAATLGVAAGNKGSSSTVLKGDVLINLMLINLMLSDKSGDTTPAQVRAALTVVAKAAVGRL